MAADHETRVARIANAVSKVADLAQLKEGWNSYDGKPIRDHALLKALLIGGEIPHIGPVGDGGVQVEWHCKGFDVEIYIPGDPAEAPTISIEDLRHDK